MTEPTEPQTIPEVVRSAVARFPDRMAIEDGETRLTFRELERAASSVAAAFLRLGIEPGDRIAVWAPNVHEWILAAVGAHLVGAVLVPINTRYKAIEAGYVLRKSRARVLCTVGEFLGVSYVELLENEY